MRHVKIIIFSLLIVLCSCNTSRHYFNMRLGSNNNDGFKEQFFEEKAVDSVLLHKTSFVETGEPASSNVKKDTFVAQDNKPALQAVSYNYFADDTTRVRHTKENEMPDFKGVRKKHKRDKLRPVFLLILLLVIFILFVVGVFVAGLLIYNSTWVLLVQNLVFLGTLLLGAALCSFIMALWQRAASRT